MTDKVFKVVGVSRSESGYKVRFATDMTRVKILTKHFTDVNLIELPTEMTKPDAVAFLKTSELYANEAYRECIDSADAKYNPVAKTATVRVKKEKVAKAPKAEKPSMDAIKARAKKADKPAAAPALKPAEAIAAAEAAVGIALM